ncbi:hypothetical protein N7537_003737 [Penicillium hordei]|uniref:Transcription factor domain-containing protein n=1 Tax=Penicillium hordei TaxID=40994 RepID=A0AAD6EAM2_9EURO|nr:uncharacterized protein N7537_003737 [Penicillium hordei]KAJ5607118.1 hypothetical protein N7537_003737 [Penicillium hordei]
MVGSLPVSSPDEENSNASSLPRHYPNPGYLGMSSHSTIFNQVFSSTTAHVAAPQHDVQQPAPPPISPALTDSIQDLTILEKGLFALSHLDQLDIPNLASLVRSWLERGVNLPLAGPFVPQSLNAVTNWSKHPKPSWNSSDYRIDARNRVRILLESTQKPIVVQHDSSFELFLSQILGENLRLEALGIFLTAAARATLDTCSFPALFATDRQRRELTKTLCLIGDFCLETCLALDCLNDLQLVLQYENLIVHSQVDGDQSYHSWRRMGDVASSLFALGYHEKINGGMDGIPDFLAELRRACFARIYAADKSLAIFLGRPPRIVKEYCFFQLPTHPGVRNDEYAAGFDSLTRSPLSNVNWGMSGRTQDNPEPINYTADTRCSALFASLKEEVLLMFRKRHLNETERISELRSRIVAQWQELPAHFRLATSLKDCDWSPFERDFLAGTRLDYLHILLLLGLVSQKRASELDQSLLEVAGEMLSITVEVIILRDRLVNSGTSLIWKVAQYGLPAAGIVSLALLHPISADCRPFPRSKMLQDLSTLVAEISIGAWIQAGEPNFALFTRATQTIRSLLDSLTAWKPHTELCSSHQNENTYLTEDWNAFIDSQPWEFEMDFWANLAEHPTLTG